MPIKYLISTFLLLLSLLGGEATAQEADHGGVTVKSGNLTSIRIAKVVIGVRVLKAELPASVTQNDAFREHEESVMDLMMLLDGQSSRKDLKVLVDLASYYLGEGPGQTLNCLLIRKGSRVLPFVEEAIKAPTSPCRQNIGAQLWEKVCLESDVLKARLSAIAKAVKAGKRCTDL